MTGVCDRIYVAGIQVPHIGLAFKYVLKGQLSLAILPDILNFTLILTVYIAQDNICYESKHSLLPRLLVFTDGNKNSKKVLERLSHWVEETAGPE